MHRIHFIDSHTGGEPTRVVLDGFAPMDSGLALAQRRRLITERYDKWRRAVACEPRGSEVMVSALLGPPEHQGSVASVIFFNNVGTIGMCGHGSIGVIETLRFLGRIGPGVHRLDTPVGTVTCTLLADGRISVANVVSYRFRSEVEVQVQGLGAIVGNVAWGGNWFFLTDWNATPVSVPHLETLTDAAWRIRQALVRDGITGADQHEIDHIELFGISQQADSRSFVLCPGKAYDRSPCGTGTSAKLACLAADGSLQPGQVWRQESVIGSVFEASYQWADESRRSVSPQITGRAHICAEGDLILDPQDPFQWGIY